MEKSVNPDQLYFQSEWKEFESLSDVFSIRVEKSVNPYKMYFQSEWKECES